MVFQAGYAQVQNEKNQSKKKQMGKTSAEALYSSYVRTIGIDSLLIKAEFLRTREPNKARAFAQAAYNRALSAENSLKQSQALTILGYIAWVQGLYDESLQMSLQALRLTEKAAKEQAHTQSEREDLTRQLTMLRRQIGNVYALQKQYTTAMAFYVQALEAARMLNDTALIVLGLNNVGAMYYYRNQHDSAIAWYEKSLEFFTEKSFADYTALTYINLAQAHNKKNLHEEAFYYATRSLVICEKTGEKRYAIAALLAISNAQRKQRRFVDAEQALKRAVGLADSLGSKELLRDSYEEYTALEEAKRNFPEALRYHRLFKAMNDSMFGEQTATRIAALSAAHQEEEQHQEIELLRATSRNQTFLRNSLLGGVGLLAIVVVLLWNRYRLKQRSEAVLQQKNMEILRQQEELQGQTEEIARINVDISQRNEALAYANREKNDLMGIVAHDLKNPLAGIQGLAAILNLEKKWSDNTEQVVEQIMTTSTRMFGLIENLLDVNALESGNITLSLQALDGVSIIRSVIEQVRSSAERKSISLVFAPDADSILVQADRNALVQVSENLISNAIKYSPFGKEVHISVRKIVGMAQFPNHVPTFFRLEVRDNGPGLSEEDRRKLFGKFVRLSAQPTGGEHSTGLGLSIVKKLVEGMQGRVWCESTLGKGATFFVELPQV